MDDPSATGTILGLAQTPGTALAIDWADKTQEVIVHELGHNLGLHHNGLGSPFIMDAGVSGTNDHLTFLEARTYSAFGG
jgi:hypothetical protein